MVLFSVVVDKLSTALIVPTVHGWGGGKGTEDTRLNFIGFYLRKQEFFTYIF